MRLMPSFFRAFFSSPFFVSVEPASVCQLRCPACPVGMSNTPKDDAVANPPCNESATQHSSRFMARDVWVRTLAEVSKTARIIQFYFQGEPLLHKDLPTMIREAHEAGLYTIVSTNGLAITPGLAGQLVQSGLDRIIVSMDGLTGESYNAYRIGGSVEKVKNALRYLREAKSVCQRSGLTTIELQCLRLRSNEHEWADFRREYKALGADRLTFKTAQLYNYADGHPLMPSNPHYSRYRLGQDGKYHRRPRWPWCTRVKAGCVITTDGDVLPCCYDKAREYVYGNIMEASLAEILHSGKARAFIRAAQKEQPAICKECWR